jgi:hypothetical protein
MAQSNSDKRYITRAAHNAMYHHTPPCATKNNAPVRRVVDPKSMRLLHMEAGQFFKLPMTSLEQVVVQSSA